MCVATRLPSHFPFPPDGQVTAPEPKVRVKRLAGRCARVQWGRVQCLYTGINASSSTIPALSSLSFIVLDCPLPPARALLLRVLTLTLCRAPQRALLDEMDTITVALPPLSAAFPPPMTLQRYLIASPSSLRPSLSPEPFSPLASLRAKRTLISAVQARCPVR